MQIKKQTDQAIRILTHLANERQAMVGKDLAGLIGVSEKYLPHIMRQLRQAGLVFSSSGISGGYILAKNAKEITLLDVMVATADEPQINCYSESPKEGSRFGTADALLMNYDFMQKIATRYFGSLSIWDLSKQDRLNDFYSKIEKINSVIEPKAPALPGQLSEHRNSDYQAAGAETEDKTVGQPDQKGI